MTWFSSPNGTDWYSTVMPGFSASNASISGATPSGP